MKLKFLNLYIFGLLTVLFFSCKKTTSNEPERIVIDFDNIEEVDIRQGELLELETTDSSLLYEINAIHTLKNKLIIQTRGKSLAFDRKGNFLFNVGVKGDAPHEYKNHTALFTKNKKIFLYDAKSKKIISYNEDGVYKSIMKVLPNSDGLFPTAILPLNGSGYIAKNTFQGVAGKTPTLSFINDKLEYVNDITERYLETGFVLSDNFVQYRDEVLYWECLNDTIFTIENYKKIKPKYWIDFNKFAIPSDIRNGKDVYDLIEYSNKSENISKTATFIRYINEDDDFLRFMFVFDKKIHYTKYNKTLKKSKTYCFKDSQSFFNPVPFLNKIGDKIYLSVNSLNDFEKNPYLIIFNDSLF